MLGGPNNQAGRLGEEKSLSLAGNRRLSRLASWPVKLQCNKIALWCCSHVQGNTILLMLFCCAVERLIRVATELNERT